MKQVLIETIPFSVAPIQLTEGLKAPSGNPLVEGILATAEVKKVLGKLEILPTVSGNILKALIENNVTVGVSSRGMGSLKQIGETLEVQDDFELLCWDFVSTPSNPGSYMHLVKEGKEHLPENKFAKVNSILTEILCANGTCPIF